jgi:LPXTG-motif cell wall-anchored protein
MTTQMSATRRTGLRPLPLLLGLSALLLAALAQPGGALAQGVVGDPTDLRFTVRNATTGQPAVAERVVIDYVAGRLNTILDTKPGGAEFTATAVPVKDIGQYIITLWYEGVPYWWQKRGTDLTAGPVALDVFGVTANLESATISGLNLVVRHRDTTAELELMVEIANDARPQVTINQASGTFDLMLPAGATGIEATYRRGPEPTAVAVTLNGTRGTISMPLTPGTNQLRLTARVPWDGALEMPVGSNLPVAAWSLLTAPPSVTVETTELQAPDETSAPGFVRRAGPALAAGHVANLRLLAGAPAGEPERLFKTPADSAVTTGELPATTGKTDKRGLPLPLAGLAVLIIIGGLIFARRRRS